MPVGDEVLRWDRKYGTAEYYYGTEPNEFLRDHAAAIPRGGRVLSLGEGEGRNAVFLARAGCEVTALDQSGAGLRKAAGLAQRHGVRIACVRTDVERYAFEPATWDAVVCIWCHLPSSVRGRVHPQLVRCLRPGGVLLVEAYTPAQLRHSSGGPRDPDLLPTLAGLREELAALEFEHAFEGERIVSEGAGHHGLGAVVQVVARRP